MLDGGIRIHLCQDPVEFRAVGINGLATLVEALKYDL